jgi:hypothetical protein
MTLESVLGPSSKKRVNENFTIQALDAEASTVAVPTAATDGIAVPDAPHYKDVTLDVVKTAASGDRDIQCRVFGYRTGYRTQSSDENSALVSTGYWVEIFDTGAIADTADFGMSWLLAGCHGFARLAVAVDTNSGTTASISAYLSFGGARGY